MTINIATHFVDQFTTNAAHLLQIDGGKLRGLVSEGSYTGRGGVVVDQYGKVEMALVTGQFMPMPRMDAATDRRWVYPKPYVLAQMVDAFDTEKLLIDPMSALTKNAVYAVRRTFDQVIFDSMFGAAKTGVDGGTTETFNTTDHRVDAAVGAAADTGLNVDKIIQARKLLRKNHVDLEAEQAYCAITAEQEEDLLRQTQMINSDYMVAAGGAPVLVDGRLSRLAGINFIHSELVPGNASYRLNPVWVPSGIHLGVWGDATFRVDQMPTFAGSPNQLSTTLTIGATRVEPGRVIQIECTE